ncbi:MAG: AAA family ATPase [Patescibacteria group bacterium]
MVAENTISLTDQDNTNSKDAEFIFDELAQVAKKVELCPELPQDLKERADQFLNRLNRMAHTGVYGAEFDTISHYIDVITSIPWNKYTEDNLDLARMKQQLDAGHYGMEGVKNLILEYMATMRLLKERSEIGEAPRAPILLLVGLQGVGKTTIAISLAKAMGREYVRIAMGAIGSVLEIRGKSKALPSAEPGQIIKGLMKAKVMNPLILLDEIEKASGQEGTRSDIMASLLEILDPSQNIAFRDHYVDYPVNLSKAMFMCTANNTGTLSAALMDRMHVVKMPSYTDEEKIVISRDYLLPGILKNNGLKPEEMQIDPNLWPSIVRPFGFDSGIRSLGRTLEAMCRKVAKELVEGKHTGVYITAENLKNYLPDTSIR